MKGLVHIYTGDGKGKTTAALGLGVRACGRGMRVLMVQFLKGTPTGEMFSLKALEPIFKLYRGTELKKFTWEMNEEEKIQTAAEQHAIFEYAVDAANGGECDLLILDEALGAISSGMLDQKALFEFIKYKPKKLELILTGRGATPELIELADYVSEIRAVKHPANKGIGGRKGIEF
ncbi:MAG: cob(I)yrinic acid a,c-diamide adenosyltransferase [Clostridiaceae bacterium]